MGKSKTVQKNEPWAPAAPYILKGMEQSQRVFDQQQPSLDKYSAMQMDTYGRVAPGAEQGILGAQGLVNDTLGGKYLDGNPWLDAMINQTKENVSNDVASRYSQAGRYGSAYGQGAMAKALADAENQARYQNYATERGYQNEAVGQAQQLMGGSQGLLNNAAELPWIGVGALNGNVRNASGGYGTQTTTQKQGIGGLLAQAGGTALSMYAGSDIRLKTNIERVGETPDGLGIYDFDYLPIEGDISAFMPEGRQRGVMAHEVAVLRPDALGPVIDGYATVNYGAL
jgi:hypothetical protein